MMIGTLLNVGAIAVGAVIGCATRFDVAPGRQRQLKILLGVATFWFGFKLLWLGLAGGPARHFFHQLAVVLVAMIVGHAVGKLCGVQAWMNRLGQVAKSRLARAGTGSAATRNDGFIAATALFCAAPLGLIGALEDGLARIVGPLAIKAVMDGLAALSFGRLFGWMALLTAIPVAALLSGISLGGDRLEPWLSQQGLLGVVHATAGLILTYIGLVIFEVKKVEIGNYLPCLIAAPALMKLSQVLWS